MRFLFIELIKYFSDKENLSQIIISAINGILIAIVCFFIYRC